MDKWSNAKWDDTTKSILNFNSFTVDTWEGIASMIPYFKIDEMC